MIKPLFDRIAVKRVNTNHTDGGIMLPPGTERYDVVTGIVAEVGPDVTAVKVDDVVVYVQYGPAHVMPENLYVMSVKDVIAIRS
jgi:co-chaperonin GroES (HSP10)